jgi:hypothetical protein
MIKRHREEEGPTRGLWPAGDRDCTCRHCSFDAVGRQVE